MLSQGELEPPSRQVVQARNGRPKGMPVAGEVIRRARAEALLTQSELAALARTTAKSVHRAERGGPMSIGVMRALCRALSLRLEDVWLEHTGPVATRSGHRAFSPPPPRSAPHLRGCELTQILDLLRPEAVDHDERRVVVLSGGPGLGKTALAAEVASRTADAWEHGVAWIDCRAIVDDTARHQLVRELADALAIDISARHPASFGRAFRYQLAARHVLIVLDGVTTPALVEDLLDDAPRCTCLVTTRSRHVASTIEGLHLELGPLTAEMTRRLLERELGATRLGHDPSGTDSLVSLLGGLPSAIDAATTALAQSPLMPPGALARNLVADARALDTAGAAPRVTYDALADYFPVLRLRALLPPGAFELLRALAPLGATPFAPARAMALAHLDSACTHRLLSALVDAHVLALAPPMPDDPRTPRLVIEPQAARLFALP